MSLRARILGVAAILLVLYAFYHYGRHLLRGSSSRADASTIATLEKLWPGRTFTSSALQSQPGIVWLKPLAADNLENAVVGHQSAKRWFVVEIFRSAREASQAFDLRTFVNNPPSAGSYYPSLVGHMVVISSGSELNISLAKHLPSS